MFVQDVKPEMKRAMAFSSPFSHQCLVHDGEWQKWHCGANLASLMQGAGDFHMCSDSSGFQQVSCSPRAVKSPRALEVPASPLLPALLGVTGALSFR